MSQNNPAPTPGQLAPDFTLAGTSPDPVTLSALHGSPVALVFFPHAFTGLCTDELCALRDNLAMFTAQGVRLLAISNDPAPALKEFQKQQGYQFDLLSDFWPHGAVSRAYGVFSEERGFAVRATFLLDEKGIVRWSVINSPNQARSIDDYRNALAAMRGGGAPAGKASVVSAPERPGRFGAAPAAATPAAAAPAASPAGGAQSAVNELMKRIPINDLAARLGTDNQTATQAIAAALPALLAQLQDNASSGDSASLIQALQQHNNDLARGDHIDLNRVDTNDGNRILSHIFGSQRPQVVQQLAATDSKASSGMMDTLLPMLAPMVMSFLSNQFLGGGRQAAGGTQPAAGQQQAGGLDIGGLLSSMLGGRQAGQSSGGLDIGGLLDGLFGRRG